jgi:thiamine-phosphate pyrophosphorylase
MSTHIYRIIDANRNRIGEGLRFLEDIARFILNDKNASEQFKSIRHTIVEGFHTINADLFSERDAEGDIGAGIDIAHQQRDLPSLVTANAKRVEEALRVLEELAKLPEISKSVQSEKFSEARFKLYDLESILFSRVLRSEITKNIEGVYVIIDTRLLGSRDILDCVRQSLSGGARIIQLRDKLYEKGDLYVIAQKIKDICSESKALFIINDYLDLVLAVDADGLHLGQSDLPLSIARRELRVDKIIGYSTHSLNQALKAEEAGVDYIGVGSVFPTTTKENADVIGLETLRTIRQAVSVPIVAIGGINRDNIQSVKQAGADSAAVISAVFAEKDIRNAVHQMVKEIEKKK